jgi:hypothetical protein
MIASKADKKVYRNMLSRDDSLILSSVKNGLMKNSRHPASSSKALAKGLK